MTGAKRLETIRCIVFAGGGVKGVAYCGALMAMESWCGIRDGVGGPNAPRSLPNLRVAAGCSVGAIFAVMSALNVRGASIVSLYENEDLIGLATPEMGMAAVRRLASNFGLDPGQGLRAAIQRMLQLGLQPWGKSQMADAITLQELQTLCGIEVHCSTICVGHASGCGPAAAGGWDRVTLLTPCTHPTMSVLDAVHMSAAVPLVYEPCVYQARWYVDGAVILNAPCAHLPPDETLLFTMDNDSSTSGASARLFDYIMALLMAATFWIQESVVVRYAHQVRIRCTSIATVDFRASTLALRMGVLEGVVSTFMWMSKNCACPRFSTVV